MDNSKVILVENVTMTYQDSDEPALNNVSFSLNKGEVLGILGPTGAGKSSLAMTLNALIPTVIDAELEGKIIVDGKDVSEHNVSEMTRSVGFVFQEPENQLSQMTIEEEIAFGLGNLGIPRKVMVTRIKESLEAVGLQGFEKRSPLALSGGQQQRLAIAAVLAMRPKIMILDEPTSMLDPKGKNEVYKVLTEIKSLGMTGIIIDHEVERLAAYCDKILVLSNGKREMFGTPKEVFGDLAKLHLLSINAPQVTELADHLNHQLGMVVDRPITLQEATEKFEVLVKQ